ncbi:hypothetical protein HU200_005291 [Digitaria exilis]|uniref:Uncharacterized protein n=1 Tax=Digitaria exilis TaxID=1010633 RepID=A0A835KSU0_9POAL|nr:hypothetical protein HU200_005291 [Digitaria exilis]
MRGNASSDRVSSYAYAYIHARSPHSPSRRPHHCLLPPDPRFLGEPEATPSMGAEAAAARRRGLLDLEAQFAFFRSQHRHPVNAAAHTLLTWPILFTNLLILHFLPLPSPVDPAVVLALAYAAAYLAVDRRAGALAGLLFVAAWAASRALAARLGFGASWRLVLATQLFCWPWQFLGHGLFEVRSRINSIRSLSVPPCSFDFSKLLAIDCFIADSDTCLFDLSHRERKQSLQKKGPTVSEIPEVFLMEPFLIFLQILNKLFGYEPYPGFCKNVDKKMEALLRESRELEQRKTT